MEAPIRSIRFIHKAIRRELETLEAAVEGVDPADGLAAVELEHGFSFLYETVKTHEDGEEDAVFPAIDEKVYPVSAPYLLDHQTDQRVLQDITRLFTRFAGARNSSERVELLRQLNRLAIEVRATAAIHIRKEEEILVPLIEQHFSIEEQGDMAGRAIAHFSPQQLQQGLPWIMKALTVDEQEDYLRMMRQSVPPDRFRVMAQWISDGVSPEEWVQMVQRVPELATVAESK